MTDGMKDVPILTRQEAAAIGRRTVAILRSCIRHGTLVAPEEGLGPPKGLLDVEDDSGLDAELRGLAAALQELAGELRSALRSLRRRSGAVRSAPPRQVP